ncbi:hypothetical protein IWQ62_002165 [Dispira parvispora]|uniref:General transcription factor TFIIB n=1 Tax=Dispira parvispora TaxID=1520584 RepID=A0A9W8ATC0_9FUNG|nr:hypothetical protein IWQ62_002165 [Dispira parvispora]
MPCPSCGAPSEAIQTNVGDGITVCTQCGLVLEQSVLTDSLEFNDRGGQTLVPQDDIPLRRLPETLPAPADVTTSTQPIPQQGATVGIQAEHPADLSLTVAGTRHQRREIIRIRHNVGAVASSLGLQSLVQRCHFIFDRLYESGELRLGRNGEVVAGACLLLAARENKRPLAVSDLAKAMEVSKPQLYRAVKWASSRLPIASGTTAHHAFLERYTVEVIRDYSHLLQECATQGLLPDLVDLAKGTYLLPAHITRTTVQLVHQLFDFWQANMTVTGQHNLGYYGATITLALQSVSHQHCEQPHEILPPAYDRVIRCVTRSFFTSLGLDPQTLTTRYTDLRRCIMGYAKELPWAPKVSLETTFYFVQDVLLHQATLRSHMNVCHTSEGSSNLRDDRDNGTTSSPLASSVGNRPVSGKLKKRRTQLAQVRDMLNSSGPATSSSPTPTCQSGLHIDPIHLILLRLQMASLPPSLLETKSDDQLRTIFQRHQTPTPPCAIGRTSWLYSPTPVFGTSVSLQTQYKDLVEGCPFCGEWHGYRRPLSIEASPLRSPTLESSPFNHAPHSYPTDDSQLTERDLPSPELRLYIHAIDDQSTDHDAN